MSDASLSHRFAGYLPAFVRRDPAHAQAGHGVTLADHQTGVVARHAVKQRGPRWAADHAGKG